VNRSTRLRVLAITKIFPNAAEPLAAPFNRQQFAALSKLCQLDVMATIPWYPGAGLMAKWSSASKLTSVPARDRIAGIDVTHPRTLFVPRLAHGTWGPLYAASIAPLMAKHRGKIDVVLGSWAYPDGFASVIAAKLLGTPSVIKLHGSDINVIAKLPGPRRLTSWALARASHVVAVSRALGDEAVALGAPRSQLRIVMNGVDEALFHPRDRAAARAELGLPAGPLVLYVGNLKEVKGVADLAPAWEQVLRTVPDATLIVVGDGPLQAEVAAGLAPFGERARMIPAQPLAQIPLYMAACDVLVLPSHNEGTPNVVLEALACGRRVVATAVGGVPDVLSRPELGALAPAKDPTALGAAIATAVRTDYDPTVVAALGARGGWDASAAALYTVLAEAAGGAG
jgi:teichuronic acid biosynthesis glycosyltransferase TuaC